MARIIKSKAEGPAQQAERIRLSRAVEEILQAVEKGGDRAVREYSRKFDGYDPESFRLPKAEVEDCVNQLTREQRGDIEFAQAQVARFATEQKKCLLDLEIETLPGVILGHRN